MNFLQSLTLKKSLLIFLFTIFFNLIITGLIYTFQYFPKEKAEYQKISEFVITKFEEKNIQISIKKEGKGLVL